MSDEPLQSHPDPQIKVRIPSALRQYTGNQKDIQVPFYEGMTVAQALCFVVHKHPDVEKQMINTEKGLVHDPVTSEPLGVELRNFLAVYVDDEDIRYLDGVHTMLGCTSMVAVASSIAGG
ncbi:MAG: hypothetical protein WC045_01025 [Patescibacteria group bacterium]